MCCLNVVYTLRKTLIRVSGLSVQKETVTFDDIFFSLVYHFVCDCLGSPSLARY